MKIVLLSLGSFILLFFITKIIGDREISQMTMFDYIVGITIGSIAAEMATSLENDFMEPVIAIIVYGISSLLISIIACKSIKLRRIINGKTIILMDNGILYKDNFKKGKIDINDFLMEARLNGYFNINDIQTAILETNGKISFLAKMNKAMVTLGDINISKEQESICTNIILDGKIIYENLKNLDKDIVWLQNELQKQNVADIKEVFICQSDNKFNISIYFKNVEKKDVDLFK